MTKPQEGKHDTKIDKLDDTIEQRNLMNLRICAQGISILLGFCLTIYLSCREQYLSSLLSLTLTIAAATSDRLKKIKISFQGLHAEWCDPRRR